MALKKKLKKKDPSISKPSQKKKKKPSESPTPIPPTVSSESSTDGFAAEVQEIRAEDVKEEAEQKRGPGRPRKVHADPSQEEKDAVRAKEILERFFGRVASAPAESLAAAYGDHWKVDADDKDLLGQATDLWVRNRLNIEMMGPGLFDIMFFGTLLMIYLPRVVMHIKIKSGEKKRKAETPDADAMPWLEGDGQELPLSISDSAKPKTRYSRPKEGTQSPGTDG